MADDIGMTKGSEVRKADHQIELFLLDRWSSRATSGDEISHEELVRLFEAARWAPSSLNAQQWRAPFMRVAARSTGRPSARRNFAEGCLRFFEIRTRNTILIRSRFRREYT
jgi:hypothetical protein